MVTPGQLIFYQAKVSYFAFLVLLFVGSGCRLMTPPASSQECSPAEDLHTSQAQQHSAPRTSLTAKLNVWNLASWNVRALMLMVQLK